MHHAETVGEGETLVSVMGDQERGKAEAFAQLAQVLAELTPQRGVEGGEGLVEEQQARPARERARDRHSLLLAARELVGMARGERPQTRGIEQLF